MNSILVYNNYNETFTLMQDGTYTVSIGDAEETGRMHRNVLHYVATILTTRDMRSRNSDRNYTHSLVSSDGILVYTPDEAPKYIQDLTFTLDRLIDRVFPRLVEYTIEDGDMFRKVIVREDGTIEVQCNNTTGMRWRLRNGLCNEGVRHMDQEHLDDLTDILEEMDPQVSVSTRNTGLPMSTIIVPAGSVQWISRPPANVRDLLAYMSNLLSYW